MSGKLPTIEDFNTLQPVDFFKVVNLLFETADPLAKGLLYKRPFNSYAQLIEQAEEIIMHLEVPDRILVINAHPRIGAPTQTLSDASKREQKDSLEGIELQKVLDELAEWNVKYESKFGFRFLVFVNGRPRSDILQVLIGRYNNSKEEEMNIALEDMVSIAKDRLKKLIS